MRAIVLALAIGFSTHLQAFEIEEEQLFFAEDESAELHILSTTDTVTFRPLIEAFQRENPALSLRYTVASSQQVFSALFDEDLVFDLVISSAMDQHRWHQRTVPDPLSCQHRRSVPGGWW